MALKSPQKSIVNHIKQTTRVEFIYLQYHTRDECIAVVSLQTAKSPSTTMHL